MLELVRSHLRHHVVGYLALFVALGSGAYAAVQIPTNSIGPKKIKSHAVHYRHLSTGLQGAIAEDEVISTTATGSAESSAAGPVEIPLSTDTFTQQAGEALLISATADFQFNGNAETTGCFAGVDVLEATDPADPAGSSLFELGEHLQAGPPRHTGSAAFPAPETDTTQTLTAVLTQRNSDDEQQGECVDLTTDPPTPVDDNWTVSLVVTATRLR